MEEEGGLGNEFCYLQRGEHPYDLRIVEFGGVTGDEYITISARGVTYFNW
jgi:dynein heavy chain